MPTQVRFRLNKITGEVEEFVVDDHDRRLSDAEHDRIALDVAQLIERRPALSEVLPGIRVDTGTAAETESGASEAEQAPESDRP